MTFSNARNSQTTDASPWRFGGLRYSSVERDECLNRAYTVRTEGTTATGYDLNKLTDKAIRILNTHVVRLQTGIGIVFQIERDDDVIILSSS